MRNLKFLSFIGINPKPFNPTLQLSCSTTLLPIIVFLIITFDPITSLPILTSCSIIVLGPIVVFEPILTFLPIKTLFPNFTDLKFFLIGF